MPSGRKGQRRRKLPSNVPQIPGLSFPFKVPARHFLAQSMRNERPPWYQPSSFSFPFQLFFVRNCLLLCRNSLTSMQLADCRRMRVCAHEPFNPLLTTVPARCSGSSSVRWGALMPCSPTVPSLTKRHWLWGATLALLWCTLRCNNDHFFLRVRCVP